MLRTQNLIFRTSILNIRIKKFNLLITILINLTLLLILLTPDYRGRTAVCAHITEILVFLYFFRNITNLKTKNQR